MSGERSNMSFLADLPSEKSLPKVFAMVAFLLLVLSSTKHCRGGGSLVHIFLLVVVLQFKMYPLPTRVAVLRGLCDSRTRFDPLQIDLLALVVIEDDEVVGELASLPILPVVVDSFVGEIAPQPFPLLWLIRLWEPWSHVKILLKMRMSWSLNHFQ
ncbi:hypothetical protein AMTR_s00019p00233760 [Amborella trichopoda]|uniref:Uncharacterized protein n=1 Tax=Amborella trichopoda TaxID=13333 RepID=W1PI98_AMBTC|nr:hypothetical protein AMTR_s00019p00233760 [Amborella trichopoda]